MDQIKIPLTKGYFTIIDKQDELDAARAYDLAAQEHFGEFARVNGIGG
jgi:hypothetical protein